MQPALVPHHQQDANERASGGGQGGVGPGQAGHLIDRRQHGQCPSRALQGNRLEQERPGDGKPRLRSVGGPRQPDQLRVVRDPPDGGEAEGRQRPRVVLQGALEMTLGPLVQGAQRRELPRRHRGQDNNAVLVGNQGRGLHRGPGPLQLFKTDLDRGDTDRLPVFRQRRRQVIARLAPCDADAEEAAGAALRRFDEVRAIGQVLADEVSLSRFSKMVSL